MVCHHFGVCSCVCVCLFVYLSLCVLLRRLVRSHVFESPGWNRGLATACTRDGHAFESLQTEETAVGQQQGDGGSSDAGGDDEGESFGLAGAGLARDHVCHSPSAVPRFLVRPQVICQAFRRPRYPVLNLQQGHCTTPNPHLNFLTHDKADGFLGVPT